MDTEEGLYYWINNISEYVNIQGQKDNVKQTNEQQQQQRKKKKKKSNDERKLD